MGAAFAREIGAQLKRAATTISRELRRNQGDVDKYHARAAQQQSAKRRHTASTQTRILPGQWVAVEARLMAEQWSPAQIASEVDIPAMRSHRSGAWEASDGGRLGVGIAV